MDVLQFNKLAPQGQSDLESNFSVCRYYELDDPDRWLKEHGAEIKAVVTSGHQGLSNAMAEQMPNLGMIAIAGVGYEHVDLVRSERAGIKVSNTPFVLTDDVADEAIGLMICAMRHLQAAGRYVADGSWRAKGDMWLSRRVSGRRYGLYGFGKIGQAIGRRLEPFGGEIIYLSRTKHDVPYERVETLQELARTCEVLFVTVSSTPETKGSVNAEVLDALGAGGTLINIARGAIVDEDALVASLVEGRLGAAGLDVFANEPNVPEALLSLPNVALAPHIGSATIEAREAMAANMLDNLRAFFEGKPLPTPVLGAATAK